MYQTICICNFPIAGSKKTTSICLYLIAIKFHLKYNILYLMQKKKPFDEK